MMPNDSTGEGDGSSRKRTSLEETEISPSKKHMTTSGEKTNENELQNKIKESELRYRCRICEVATFSNEKALTRHHFSHFVSTTTLHRCQHCHESFDTSDKFQSHITDTHLEEIFICSTCHNVVKYCSVCYTIFNSRREIDTHFMDKYMSEMTIFRCLTCLDSSTVYHSEDELAEHVYSAHFYSINKPMMPNDSTFEGEGSSRKGSSLEGTEISLSKKHATMSSEKSNENEAEAKESQLQYRCSICDVATFSNEKVLTRHQFSHFVSTTTMHRCQHCRESFDASDKFQSHITDKHLQQFFSCTVCHHVSEYCSVCLELLESRKDIDTHFMDIYQSEMKIFRCLSCQDSTTDYYSEDELAEHVYSTHFCSLGKPIMPNDSTVGEEGSSRKSSSLEGMEISPSKKHRTTLGEKSNENENKGKESELQYRCSICRVATFSNKKDLTRHQFNHFVSTTTAHHCKYCRELFDASEKFQRHILDRHLGKIYACFICYEIFISRNDIDTHFVVKHKNEIEIIRCLGCPDSSTIYYSEDELEEHLNSAHIYSIDKQMIPNDLTVGSEESSRKGSSLEGTEISPSKKHATTSSEKSNETENKVKESELQYRCSICEIAIVSNKKDLRRHHLNHFVSTTTGHCCKLCQETFDTSDKFQRHMTDKHLRKLYYCYVCYLMLNSRNSVYTHFIDKHKDETESFRCLGCSDSSTIYCSEDKLAEHVNSKHISTEFVEAQLSALSINYTPHNPSQEGDP